MTDAQRQAAREELEAQAAKGDPVAIKFIQTAKAAERSAGRVILRALKGSVAKPISEHVEDAVAPFQKIMEDLAGHRAKWEAEFYETDVETLAKVCPDHGLELEVDHDLSQHHSRVQGRFIVEHKPCPECHELARQEAWLGRHGVPEDYAKMRFGNWEAKEAGSQAILDVCQRYAKAPKGFLVLISPGLGNGKTHLAIAIMRAIERGRFVFVQQFLEQIRFLEDREAISFRERLATMPFLVLDDLGVQTLRNWDNEVPRLHDLLNERCVANLPTILTANVGAYNDLEPVIGSRALDRIRPKLFDVCILTGATMRKVPDPPDSKIVLLPGKESRK